MVYLNVQRKILISKGQTTPEVAVIFHDACYGHRYSRPKTSKANLSLIVERPERILATVLGVSTAYVHLGGRHSGGLYPPQPKSSTNPIPFAIRKSSRRTSIISPAVTNVHGIKWMTELKVMCEAAETKLTLNGKELVRPAMPGDNEKPKFHEGDLYLCAESLEAFEGALGGVLDAVDTVFDTSGSKRCFVSVRPPGHHCSNDYPSWFNTCCNL
jgi:histone deacetylase HOS3